MKRSGIYQIRNTLNNKRYVGSTNYLKARLTEHKRKLVKHIHPNKHLQSAFLKYGAGNFIFEVVEECPLDDLLVREQYFIDLYKELGLYNIVPLAASPARGYRHTEEAKEKIRQASISRIGKTTFKKGQTSWNKGKKGIHNGSSTSFKKGHKSWNTGLRGQKPYMDLTGLEKGRGLFKGTKGILKANSGSFKKGMIPWNKKVST